MIEKNPHRTPVPAMGRAAPAATALRVLNLGLPVLAALVLFDVLVWAAGQYLMDTCIGIWCWF